MDMDWLEQQDYTDLREKTIIRATPKMDSIGIHDPEDVADFIDEAATYFIKHPETAERLLPDKEHLINYWVNMAVCRAIDSLRTRHGTILVKCPSDETDLLDFLTSQSVVNDEMDIYSRCEIESVISRALSAMNSRERQAWMLFLDWYALEEIGSEMDISADAARQLLKRGAKRARGVLAAMEFA